MSGLGFLALATGGVMAAGLAERWAHRRALGRLGVRVHVNGTRGKSSVTRLIAAGLREAGLVTCAKTTGTLARFILPDGRELPIFRPAGANIIEQKRIVAAAAEHGAQALVIECMALQPELQALSELELVQATHGVITNARPDHLDVMGPGPADVALALAGMIPVGGKLFTAEREQLPTLEAAARDRGTTLIAVGAEAVAAVGSEQLRGFSYTEHPDNVALALTVCADLGVPAEVALRGMHRAAPDPGALTVHRLDWFGREIWFWNAFAANDPVSTSQLWHRALAHHPGRRRLAIFNCRADRPERSIQLGEAFATWSEADHVLLMGTGTHLFARAAAAAGVDPFRIVVVEERAVPQIFEAVLGLVEERALVVGMGNVGGQGLELASYFANRGRREAA